MWISSYGFCKANDLIDSEYLRAKLIMLPSVIWTSAPAALHVLARFIYTLHFDAVH